MLVFFCPHGHAVGRKAQGAALPSAQIPRALALHHGHAHALPGAVAVGEDEVGVGHVGGGVGVAALHAHALEAAVFLLLLGHEHLGVGLQLLAVALGNALGAVDAVDEGLVVAAQQLVVVALGGMGGDGGRLRPLLPTRGHSHNCGHGHEHIDGASHGGYF